MKKNRSLPKNTYKSIKKGESYYSYKRPDNQAYRGIGKNKEKAIKTARILNYMFYKGIDENKLHPKAYIKNIQYFIKKEKFIIPYEARLVIKEYFNDEFFFNAQEIKAWSTSDESGQDKKQNTITHKNVEETAQKLLQNCKRNAKIRGSECTIDKYVIINLLIQSEFKCNVTGVKLIIKSEEQSKERHPWSASIDRIDSSIGYTKENCRITCLAANLAMSTWGEKVLIKMAKSIALKHSK